MEKKKRQRLYGTVKKKKKTTGAPGPSGRKEESARSLRISCSEGREEKGGNLPKKRGSKPDINSSPSVGKKKGGGWSQKKEGEIQPTLFHDSAEKGRRKRGDEAEAYSTFSSLEEKRKKWRETTGERKGENILQHQCELREEEKEGRGEGFLIPKKGRKRKQERGKRKKPG